MGSTFNPQILVEKLAKLNSSQASIETLSHWCIFHMNKAKYVVETWERQFHSSPREQRLAFLYLANDILQNSRRKGSDFVGEFWRVLPDALRDVIHNGDDFGRTAAYRLINIWEDRKVFGSRGQILKEEFKGRLMDGGNRNVKDAGVKPKKSAGSTLDKIVSCYQVVNGGQMDEEVILGKCRSTVGLLEKMEKDAPQNNLGKGASEASFVEDLQGQHAVLRNCIEQLTAVESSRVRLISYLRDALQEQEFKLDQVRNQLQAARSRSEKTTNVYRNLGNGGSKQLLVEHHNSNDIQTSIASPTYVPVKTEQSAPVMYTLQPPYPEISGHIEDESKNSSGAAMATKLTQLTSSSQVLSSVLTSLASEGVIGNPKKDVSGDYAPEKRPRLDNSQPSFQHLEPRQHDISPGSTMQPPLPTSSAPPIPPPPSGPPAMAMAPYPGGPPPATPPFMQVPGSVTPMPFHYSMNHQQLPSVPSFTVVPPYPAAPPNVCQSFPSSDGGYYSQPASVPMAPMPRQ